MHIALLTDGIYPYVIGGMQNHSFYLARYFLLNKVKLTLVHCVAHSSTLPPEGETLKKLFPENHTEYASLLTEICLKFPEPGIVPGHYLRNSFRYSFDVFNRIKARLNEFDFIYVQGFSGWKLIDEKRKGLKAPPVGVHFHGLNMFQRAYTFKTRLQNWLLSGPVMFNLQHADVILMYQAKIKDILVEKGLGNKRMIHQPNGIDSSWFIDESQVKNHSPRRFVFIGRYERLKGIEELQQAIQQLGDVPFHFTFIGNIPVSKRIANDSVKYLGVVAHEEIVKAYRSSDVLVIPSWSEGMPTVILEAMASGLAVIATDVGAVPTMTNNASGWLIEPGNIAMLKETLHNAIAIGDDEMLLKKKNAIARAKSFLWDNLIKDLITEIESLNKNVK